MNAMKRRAQISKSWISMMAVGYGISQPRVELVRQLEM